MGMVSFFDNLKQFRLRQLAVAVIAAANFAFAGCGHDDPPERTLNVRPSGSSSDDGANGSDGSDGSRPGVEDSNDFKGELGDGVWRITGLGVSLRYDRGGVLFATRKDGSIRVQDLDGIDEVMVKLGHENADSTFTGASIKVNGRELEMREVKMMQRGEGRTWYRVSKTSAGNAGVMVLP